MTTGHPWAFAGITLTPCDQIEIFSSCNLLEILTILSSPVFLYITRGVLKCLLRILALWGQKPCDNCWGNYQGRKWNMPDFGNRYLTIIVSLKFISSFEAVTFSFTNLLFPPSHFSLLSSSHSLCCLPHFASTASRKKTSSQKNSLHFEHNAKH